MNVNITGIYNNTVIVDTNLFEDVRLLQTGLSSLSDTLFDVVQGLPYKYANLTTFTILSDDYDSFKNGYNYFMYTGKRDESYYINFAGQGHYEIETEKDTKL